ncbi:MAG: aminopeptidase N [Xanthomonadales bacterium]|nr:aminopeptidase N [Xanthomonadales bacterium]NIN58729.1 aminopeptidase N [Xanthomonadales bacterium]NIN73995.1 aminopeptidase N [Xanthomonadales bacterium]NIO12910.1 aminopeptidase N [Xanthomonadales bacterium]NIP11122.1 aminopeptidase N [Xanthomonadales bacterium]
MKKGAPGKAIQRADYLAYPWSIDHLDLDFSIHEQHTQVRSRLQVSRRAGADAADAIELDGRDLELVTLAVDGQAVPAERYRIEGERMVITGVPERFELSAEVRIRPSENTALEGLYRSGEFLLTQCEAEGFRKITWFPDRPDVMTRYSVTIEADRDSHPVLLCNGNRVDGGVRAGGRHWVRWEDPFPKPSYLFALVAGDLAHVEDRFTTRSGREVTLRIYVEHENIDRCEHAMESLKKAMCWDEERFALEYDLDIYNIVATNDFNMGAMENKSLNIFNSKYVLARPDTATDADYQAIEGVIGHEYFHNWTGNRVTCRDWFQLTLKEGLTVFRDEEFSSDMQSRAVKRIQDVRDLRERQFPEDAGPMAHPIRPDHYIEVNNFYTATVYQKGAAVIRLYHTLLGEDGFQKGMQLYFERHDGQAVTCDDFLAAMADANDAELGQFARWYAQSGTPVVSVATEFEAAAGRYVLRLRQETPPTHDQPDKQPLLIPFAVGLLDPQGQALALQLEGERAPGADTRMLLLTEAEQEFTFIGLDAEPVPSLLRDFSAPVKVEYEYAPQQLATLMAHDTDAFARWEASQRFAQDCILAQVRQRANGRSMHLAPGLVAAFGRLLEDRETDPALLAEAMALPAEDYLAEQMDVVDVDGIHVARRFIKAGLAEALGEAFRQRYAQLGDNRNYDNSPRSIAERSLRNLCLAYLAETAEGTALASLQLEASDNMTNTLAALRALVFTGSAAAGPALEAFERRWRGDALVMDKWFAMQAMTPGHETIERVEDLMEHPEFSIRNPNKVRALVGVFAMLNPTGFHAPNGAGYRFLAQRVLDLDAINPQMAARMVTAFNRWKRYDEGRKRLMKAQLERIAAVEGLSPDVSEIVSNALQ